MAAEIGLSVAKKITELLIDPIQRELGYFFCFNNNIQELESRIIELKATRSDVQGREDVEQRMRKTLGQRVELWIKDANGKIAEAENVINDKAQLQKGCFSIIKWCPNIRLRFTFGREGKKLSLVLKEILQSGDSLPRTGHALPMPPINMSHYNGDACDFRSRGKFMDEIIEMLRDEETMLIGICGMGGLGKTTFAKQLLQKIEIPHLMELEIISMPNITTLCNIMNSSLQKLKISQCDNFKYVFSNSFIKNIPYLKILTISKCQMLKGIIRVSTSIEEQGKKSIEFPKLEVLELESLDKLVSFVIHDKNLDDDEEKEDGDEEKLQNSLFYCDNEYRVLFPCLNSWRIHELSKIYHIVGWKVGQDEGPHVKEHQEPISLSLFPMLEWLKLSSLSNLIHVYESNHPKLEVSLFQNMKYMWIRDCGKLRYLFTENIGRVVAMQLLDITNCPRMEVVMKNDAEKDEDEKARGRGEGIIPFPIPNTHIFPLLGQLRLINIPCLRSFADVGYTWTLPSLYWLTVSACPKLEALSPSYLDSPKLYIITYNNRERKVENWNGDINNELRDLFIQLHAQKPPDDLPVAEDNNIDKELARQ